MQTRPYASLLLITGSQDTAAHFAAFLPADRFAPELNVCSPLEAPYVLDETSYDVVVIDGTVPSEAGMTLAAKAVENGAAGVLLLAEADQFGAVAAYGEQHGFMTLQSPVDPVLLKQSLGMMAAVSQRLHALESKAEKLEKKMDELRVVNRAKLLLIQRFKMTEKQAHRFIEKNAMDRCVTRRAVAEKIIRTYDI